jgi:hypothetical protein
LHHRRWIGKAGGLDNDVVEPAATLQKPAHGARQIAANGAADATVVELKNFLLGADHELAVDAGFAKLIDDNRDLLPSCTDRI